MSEIRIPPPATVKTHREADPYMEIVSAIVGDTWYAGQLSGTWVFTVNGKAAKANSLESTRSFVWALTRALSEHYDKVVVFVDTREGASR